MPPATRGEFYTPRPSSGSWSQSPIRSWAKSCSTRPAAPAVFWSRRLRTWKSSARRSQDREMLQEKTILGGEAKSLPYMLCADEPAAARAGIARVLPPATALRVKITEIGDKDQRGRDPHQSAIRRRRGSAASRTISRRTSRPAKRRCCSCNSSCESCVGRVPAELAGRARGRSQRHTVRRWRLRPHQGGTAQRVQPAHNRAPAQSACLRRTPAFRQICCSLIAPARPRTSGTTSRRCQKDGRNTPRRIPCQFEEFADCIKWFQQKRRRRRSNPARRSGIGRSQIPH